MEQLTLQLPNAAPLPLVPLLVNLGAGLLLSLALRWHFQRFGSTLSNRAEFAAVFPFIVLTTVLIITVVKSSLALSLGLVGALSIVRFRTPIKEPEELAYLFMSIAMGLGLGADQLLPTVVASLVILLSVGVLRYTQRNVKDKALFLSVDWSGYDGGERQLDALNDVVARHVSLGDIRRVDARDGGLEATYYVDVSESGKISTLLDDLKRSFPGIGVSFIDQNRLPSV
jgi:uncharacterized membrane protein YhiD involved in acid resistance